jgi:hypothetical protein
MQIIKESWKAENVKKLLSYLSVILTDFFHATQRPQDFFGKLKHDQDNKNKAFTCALVLSLAFSVVEMPIMKKVGVDYANPYFLIIQTALTFSLILLYSSIFHLFVRLFNTKSLWIDTYKVFVFALFWFLLAYLPLFLEQYARYEAMAQNTDFLSMGFYKPFRASIDGSSLIAWLQIITLLFFYSMFLRSFHKGIRILSDLNKYQAAVTAIGGLIVMHVAVFIIQHPINHVIIQAFKNS